MTARTWRTIRGACGLLAALYLAGCDGGDKAGEQTDYTARAKALAQEAIIIDTHIDVPYRINREYEDVTVATADGDFDYPRAAAGGLDAPFMSIYTPASSQVDGTATALADALINMTEDIAARAPDKFELANSVADVVRHHDEGRISLVLGMENGAPIAGDMNKLRHFRDRGVRYITLAHSKWNHISDSSYDPDKHWGGLSPFGKELVRAMNDLGVMVDVSHISDDAFWDVMEITRVPVIASHSSARHFTPGWERNMSDEMIKRLAENGGVVMINFGSSFLTQTAREFDTERDAAFKAWIEAEGAEQTAEAREAFRDLYVAEHGPYPYATLDDVLDHFDHVVSIAGVDHVGIGSDFDGVGDTLPIGLKDVSNYPNLIEGLLRRGYSEEDVVKILGRNLLRVWAEVEAYAAARGADTQ